MTRLKTPILLETAFHEYEATEILGEGGAGRVYGTTRRSDGTSVAIKVLTAASRDKRARFKNEIGFLIKHKHDHLVDVMDHGVLRDGDASKPFYVMHRYEGSLRDLMDRGVPPDQALRLYLQLLRGIEAAHLYGAMHRDLKPENVLYRGRPATLAIADFGIAHFEEELLMTAVETRDSQRMANFQYAAPEQRVPGSPVGVPADMYALGLMLNELFTKAVPHGTEYRRVAEVAPAFSYLDDVVARLLRQDPADRIQTVRELRGWIQRGQSEYEAAQQLSAATRAVIPGDAVDDPLANEPPVLIHADWADGTLTLKLDRPVHPQWADALVNIGSYTSVLGAGPRDFRFQGDEARVRVEGRDAQQVINHFKEWLPRASMVLKGRLQQEAARRQHEQQRALDEKIRRAQERTEVLGRLKI